MAGSSASSTADMADERRAVDQQGDVVLLCAAPAEETANNATSSRIRVSSHVMRINSPVFAAMLRPDFKEGKQLAANGAVEIPLPDDHSLAMLILCNVLHLRHSRVPRKLTAALLYEVAVLAHKYDCTKSLGPVAEHWLLELLNGSVSDQLVGLTSAYLLRLPSLYTAFGEELVKESSKIDASRLEFEAAGGRVAAGDAADEIREVVTSLDLAREKGYKSIVSYIEERIGRYCNLDATHVCFANCFHSLVYGGAFMQELFRKQLWPPNALERVTLSVAFNRMRNAGLSLPLSDKSNQRTTCHQGKGCFIFTKAAGSTQAQKSFTYMADKLEKEISKICLGCTVEGKTYKEEGCTHDSAVKNSF